MTNHHLHLHPSLSPQPGTPGRLSPAVGNPCGDAPDIAARPSRGAGSAGHAVDGRHPSRVALALHPAGSAGGDTFMGRPSGVPPRSVRHASHHRVMQRSNASGRRFLPSLGPSPLRRGRSLVVLARCSDTVPGPTEDRCGPHPAMCWRRQLVSAAKRISSLPKPQLRVTPAVHGVRAWPSVEMSGRLNPVCPSPPMASVGQTPVRLAGRVVKALPRYPLGAVPRGQA